MTKLSKVWETIIGIVVVGFFIGLAKIYGYWVLIIPVALVAFLIVFIIYWINKTEKGIEKLKVDRKNQITEKWNKRKEKRNKTN